MRSYAIRALSLPKAFSVLLISCALMSCNKTQGEKDQVIGADKTEPGVARSRQQPRSTPTLAAEVRDAGRKTPALISEQESDAPMKTSPTVEAVSHSTATRMAFPTVTPAPDVKSALAGTRQFVESASPGEKSLPQEVAQPISVQLENLSRMAGQDPSYSAEQRARIGEAVEKVEKLLNRAVSAKNSEEQRTYLGQIQAILADLEKHV